MKTKILLFSLFAILFSCSKENNADSTKTDTSINVNVPNSNNLILQETISTISQSSIYKIIAANDGNIVYIGSVGGNSYAITKTNTNGQIIWTRSINFSPTDIKQISNNLVGNDTFYNGFVVIGGNNGNIITIDKNGNVLDQKQIGIQSSILNLYSFNEVFYPNNSKINDYYSCGATSTSGTYYPYYKGFSTNENGIITGDFVVETMDIPLFFYEGIDGNNQDKIAYQITGNRNDGLITSSTYYSLLAGKNTNDKHTYFQKRIDTNIAFTKDFTNYYCGSRSMQYYNNNIYISGAKIDVNSSTTYTDGSKPTDAFIIKLDDSGNTIWENTYSCAEDDNDKNDFYNQVFIYNNKLYVCGASSVFNYTSNPNTLFGNGLISTCNLDGTNHQNYTIGNQTYKSSLNTLLYNSNGLLLAGYTKNSNNNYNAWLLKFNP